MVITVARQKKGTTRERETDRLTERDTETDRPIGRDRLRDRERGGGGGGGTTIDMFLFSSWYHRTHLIIAIKRK